MAWSWLAVSRLRFKCCLCQVADYTPATTPIFVFLVETGFHHVTGWLGTPGLEFYPPWASQSARLQASQLSPAASGFFRNKRTPISAVSLENLFESSLLSDVNSVFFNERYIYIYYINFYIFLKISHTLNQTEISGLYTKNIYIYIYDYASGCQAGA